MNNFDIYVDSGANIPDELLKKHGITVVPFSCIINGEEKLCYEKERPFKETAREFYKLMREGAEIKTSLVPKERFIEYAETSLKEGRDAIIFTISSGISGTYNQAVNAEKELEEKYAANKVYVCDTANASMGSGMLALKIADLRDMGESAETCAKWAEENVYKINSYVTVGDLKYLRKGGRISTTLAIAGTLLNIKPVLWADGGSPAKLSFFGKERGRKKALSSLADSFVKNAEDLHQTVAITHADCIEDAEELAQMVKERGATDVIIEYYDLCTGCHAGPGTVALFFFGKDRRGDAVEAEKKTLSNPAVQKI